MMNCYSSEKFNVEICEDIQCDEEEGNVQFEKIVSREWIIDNLDLSVHQHAQKGGQNQGNADQMDHFVTINREDKKYNKLMKQENRKWRKFKWMVVTTYTMLL